MKVHFLYTPDIHLFSEYTRALRALFYEIIHHNNTERINVI